MKTYLNKNQQLVYKLGVDAFNEGKLFEDNPFCNGDLQSKCLWAAGWVDRNRGMA